MCGHEVAVSNCVLLRRKDGIEDYHRWRRRETQCADWAATGREQKSGRIRCKARNHDFSRMLHIVAQAYGTMREIRGAGNNAPCA